MFAQASLCLVYSFFFFFFNDTATTEIYTRSLHDALPISGAHEVVWTYRPRSILFGGDMRSEEHTSELQSRFGISYAVFCLKKTSEIQSRFEISSAAFCLKKRAYVNDL